MKLCAVNPSYMKVYILIICFSIIGCKLFAQEKHVIVDSLNKYIKPVATNEDQSFDISALINVLKNKHIVSLGEATHGTKEFYDAKTQIIKGLITNGNFKTIFIESDYSSLIYLNEILQNDSKDTALSKRFGQKGIYSIYKTKEVFNLFYDVRAYNHTQQKENQVAIIGIDMQDLVMISKRVLYEIPDSGKNDTNVYHTLIGMTRIFATGELKYFTKKENIRNLEAIAKLKENASIKEDKKLIFLTRQLEQSYEMMNTKSDEKRRSLRDTYMAENVIWLNKNLRQNANAVIWAHNGHTSNISSFNRVPMGFYLKQEFKDNLYSLGLLFGEGKVRLLETGKDGYQERYITPSVNLRSFENLLASLKAPIIFLNFQDILSNDFIKKEIENNSFIRSIGTHFLADEKNTVGREPILLCFDGILFFKQSSSSKVF